MWVVMRLEGETCVGSNETRGETCVGSNETRGRDLSG